MDQKLIDALIAVKQQQQDDNRSELVFRVHASGRLTARERINALLDADSAVEYGSIAARTRQGDWIAEAGGIDFVGTIDGQTVIASATDYTDHGGGYGAGRLGRLYALAQEHRWPLVFFVDGGGSRARHPRTGQGHFELSGPIGRFMVIEGNAELSGRVPTIAIVSGPAFAGHASLAGFSDIIIATRGSAIGIGGPPMVEAALGMRLKTTELAGVDMHELSGGIDLLVDDDPAAINAAKMYLSFYKDQPSGNESATAAEINKLVPEQGPYDMHQVIKSLVDDRSLFELRPVFAPSLITALARMNGRSVGIIANQPLVNDGTIDQFAAAKLSRFIELCDAYEYPIISLIDTPGCVNQWPGENDSIVREAGITRWHTRSIIAHQNRTVPLFSVQIRHTHTMGVAMMSGFSSSLGVPPLCLAWPLIDLEQTDGFSSISYGRAIDDVVVPCETRERIVRLLGHLRRNLDRDGKKHTIDTW